MPQKTNQPRQAKSTKSGKVRATPSSNWPSSRGFLPTPGLQKSREIRPGCSIARTYHLCVLLLLAGLIGLWGLGSVLYSQVGFVNGTVHFCLSGQQAFVKWGPMLMNVLVGWVSHGITSVDALVHVRKGEGGKKTVGNWLSWLLVGTGGYLGGWVGFCERHEAHNCRN